MSVGKVREKLEAALEPILHLNGFMVKGDNCRIRESPLTKDYLFLNIQQKLGNKYKVFLKFCMQLKDVNNVLVDKFNFPMTELPPITVAQASTSMNPKGSWDISGPKGTALVEDEIRSFILSHGFNWFESHKQIEVAKSTILRTKFDSAYWRWQSILAILWMLHDSDTFREFCPKVHEYIETVNPLEEPNFVEVYHRFRLVDPVFFTDFVFERKLIELTSDRICRQEIDERIQSGFQKGSTPISNEPCDMYVIYGSVGSLQCNDAGWQACLDAIAPLLEIIVDKRKYSSVEDSIARGEFHQKLVWIPSATDSEPPKLLFLVQKERTSPDVALKFNPSIVLFTRRKQDPSVPALAENCARFLAHKVRALLLAKQVRPYYLPQTTWYGTHAPIDGMEVLRRRGNPHRIGASTDTLEGTWQQLL